MESFILEHYFVIKALHIIAIIAWMAGLLYLPRLYVYHANAQPGSELDLTLQTMERRLLKTIMNPAMIASFVLGGALIVVVGFSHIWLHIKLLLVLLLAASHGMMAKFRKDFVKGTNRRSSRFYRILNEVPTVLMIGIVFLVVLQRP